MGSPDNVRKEGPYRMSDKQLKPVSEEAINESEDISPESGEDQEISVAPPKLVEDEEERVIIEESPEVSQKMPEFRTIREAAEEVMIEPERVVEVLPFVSLETEEAEAVDVVEAESGEAMEMPFLMVEEEVVEFVEILPLVNFETEEASEVDILAEESGEIIVAPARGATLFHPASERHRKPVEEEADRESEDRAEASQNVVTPLVGVMGGESQNVVAPLVGVMGGEAEASQNVVTPLVGVMGGVQDTPVPALETLEPLKQWLGGKRKRPRMLRTVVASLLLLLLSASTVLLWRDVTDTHLYAYSIDPQSGRVLAQQDIGGGYQGKAIITAPVAVQSLLFFGIQTSQTASRGKPQVLGLAGSETSWHVDTQFSTPLTPGSLSVAPGGYLVVEDADGIQVMNSAGHLLWQVQGQQPARGIHTFQPAFDDKTLYTVRAASSGQVAAYNLQTGALRWTQMLEDALNYAPPMILSGDAVLIASDHNIYALNRADGSLLWKKPGPARTLLLLNKGEHPMLVAAGAEGLTAFDAATGAQVWSFHGETGNDVSQGTAMLTPAQFYQAAFSSTDSLIYATGVAWDEQQVREQLWLYAVDVSTGTVRWSKQIGTSFRSVDSGRVFTPFVDDADGIVVLQHENDQNDYLVTAFDARSGTQRWSTHFASVTATSPALIQTSRGELLLLATVSSGSVVPGSWSLTRLLLIITLALSGLGLLLLWILPFQLWLQRLRGAIRNMPRYLISPLKLLLRFWRFSHRLFALVLLLLLVGGGVLEHAHLNQSRTGLYQVMLPGGAIQWQQTSSPPVQPLAVDAQGSILDTNAGEELHQLSALDQNGALLWKTFASEGSFSLPVTPAQSGTILVALSGHTTLNYQVAPDDPAYLHPLDHLHTLILLKRSTGQVIWQSTIVNVGEQQDAVVLGADARFFYVASLQTEPSADSSGPAVQLLAVEQSTGNIEWRVFGPVELDATPPDFGKLLPHGRQVIWQVAGNLYAIDTLLGQIQWRQHIDEGPQVLLREEAGLALAAGVLLVERSDSLHGLDTSSGKELWVLPNPDSRILQRPAGIVATGNLFLIYGDGFLEAVDAITHQTVWSHNELDEVEQLRISDDGTMAYVVLIDTIAGSSPAQVLTALDLKTGSVHWTFQPTSQLSFVHLQSDGLQYQHGRLFTTVCFSSYTTDQDCTHEGLYALNAATGAILWKFEATNFARVYVSADGGVLLFQATSSDWLDFIQRFRE
jgi:outer membrane protein assembly factor BamB